MALDPVSVAAITGLVRSGIQLIKDLKANGQITEEQAKSMLDAVDADRQAAVDAWNAGAPDGG